MSAKTILRVLDVDGTLVDGDTMLLFANFLNRNRWKTYGQLVRAAPFGIRGSQAFKQAFLKYLLQDHTYHDLQQKAQLWWQQQGHLYVKPLARKAISLWQEQGDTLVLLSASADLWLQPMAQAWGAGLLCTGLAYDDEGRYQKLATANCKGGEKWKRLQQAYPPGQYGYICYADSASDRVLEAHSEQFFYKPF